MFADLDLDFEVYCCNMYTAIAVESAALCVNCEMSSGNKIYLLLQSSRLM